MKPSKVLVAGAVAVAAGLVACSGLLKSPTNIAAGGTFTISMSNVQASNLMVTTFEAKSIAGNWTPGQVTDAGWSTVLGAPNALDTQNQKCRSIAVGFAGKPAVGQTVHLLSLNAPDAGPATTPDGGALDLSASGTLLFQEGCVSDHQLRKWTSASGTLTIDTVGPPPDASSPPTAHQVKFHYSGVPMAPTTDGLNEATGTFEATGSGQADLFLIPQ
jgi:hypothetical protein